MIQKDLEYILSEVVQQQDQKRQVARAVDYLMIVLCIPSGNRLAMYFGTGQERSNHKALITWVSSILHELDLGEAELHLDNLVRRTQLKAASQLDET